MNEQTEPVVTDSRDDDEARLLDVYHHVAHVCTDLHPVSWEAATPPECLEVVNGYPKLLAYTVSGGDGFTIWFAEQGYAWFSDVEVLADRPDVQALTTGWGRATELSFSAVGPVLAITEFDSLDESWRLPEGVSSYRAVVAQARYHHPVDVDPDSLTADVIWRVAGWVWPDQAVLETRSWEPAPGDLTGAFREGTPSQESEEDAGQTQPEWTPTTRAVGEDIDARTLALLYAHVEPDTDTD